MAESGQKYHNEILYSAMIFTTVMNCSYNEIMDMPFKTYNKLLKYKADFEQQKQTKIEESTRQSSTQKPKTMNPIANELFNKR